MQRRGDFLAEQQDRRHRLVGPGIARGQVHWAAGCRLRTLEGSQVDGDPLRVGFESPEVHGQIAEALPARPAQIANPMHAAEPRGWVQRASRGLNGLVT